MAKVGGKRPGAGRKPGSVTKRSQEIAAKAVAAGITPLELMLSEMRIVAAKVKEARADFENEKNLDAKVKIGTYLGVLLGEMRALATAAAPYLHPRLAATQVTGKDGGPVKVSIEGKDKGVL